MRDTAPGSPTCKGTATYHENPRHLFSINSCPMHEKVVAGHSYSVTARYDNSQRWDDVMGIVLAYVWWGTQ